MDYLAYLFFLQNKYEEAREYLKNQKNPTVLHYILLLKMNKCQDSLTNLINLTDLKDEDDYWRNMELGDYYCEQKDYENSRNYFGKISKKDDYCKGMGILIDILENKPNINFEEIKKLSKKETKLQLILGNILKSKFDNSYINYLEQALGHFSFQAMILLGDKENDSYFKKALTYGWNFKQAEVELTKHGFKQEKISELINNTTKQYIIPGNKVRRDLLKNALNEIIEKYSKRDNLQELKMLSKIYKEANPVLFMSHLSVIQLDEFGLCFSNGTIENLERLLNQGKFYYDHFDDYFENTGLHIAAFFNKRKIISWFIEKYKSSIINKANKFGWTPLHIAVMNGSKEAIKALVKKCDLDIKDRWGRTPLHLAVIMNQYDCINLLTNSLTSHSKNTSNIDIRDNDGLAAIHYAVILSHYEIIKILIDLKADLNVQCFNGNTPLHYAVYSDSIVPIKYLVYAKALFIENNKKELPFYQSNINESCKKWYKNVVTDEITHHFKNLIFHFSGIKGISYLGILESAEKEKVFTLNKIERVGGISSGSIIAFLLGIGISINHINVILSSLNFNDFKESNNNHQILQEDYTPKLYSIYSKIKDLKSQESLPEVFSGDKFENWVNDTIYNKTYISNATFRNMNGKGKELYLVGLNLSTFKKEIFSNETTPDMPISTAVRISMAIPGLFKPVKYKDNLYIDGGLYDELPLYLFDDYKYFSDKEGKAYNPESLNFMMVKKKENFYFLNKEEGALNIYIDDLMKMIESFRYKPDNTDLFHQNLTCFIESKHQNVYTSITNDFSLNNNIKKLGNKAIENFMDRTQINRVLLDNSIAPILIKHQNSLKLIKNSQHLEMKEISLKKSPKLILDLFLFLYPNDKKIIQILKELILDIEMIDPETDDSILTLFLNSILKEPNNIDKKEVDKLSLLIRLTKQNTNILNKENKFNETPISIANEIQKLSNEIGTSFLYLLKLNGAKV